MPETREVRYANPDHCPTCGQVATFIGVQRPDYGDRYETWCSNAHCWLATVTEGGEVEVTSCPVCGTTQKAGEPCVICTENERAEASHER